MRGSKSLSSFVRRAVHDWFVVWYMGRVAGRYCPCEWPIKSVRLMAWCARMDDAGARLEFIRFAGFHTTTTTSGTSAQNVRVTYTQPPREKHGS